MGQLVVEMGPRTASRATRAVAAAGHDVLFDDQTREKFIPHVIEPSAGADRGTPGVPNEAYHEDTAPDENGKPTMRVVLKLHPRLAPIKAAIFPLVKKDGMPEIAQEALSRPEAQVQRLL